MGSQILSLIHDKTYIGKAPATDVSERRYHQLFLIHHFCDARELFIRFAVLILNELQVIPQRLHVWINLGFYITRQISDIFIAQRNNWTSKINLFVFFLLFQCRRKGKQCFTSASNTLNRYQFYFWF